MDVVHTRCCGVDVHKKTMVACLIVPGSGAMPRKEIRTFGTMTTDLLALVDWLVAAGCTHVAMESTGVYWKPLYNLLEGTLEVLVVNAQHIKNVPGRKTDVRDCAWIADLLRHGLLRASFIPDRPQRELRELTRYRTSLIRERSAEVNRLQKTLEGANIKLAAVAHDIVGASGRDMLAALLTGTLDAPQMAQLARGRLREKIPQLEQALVGHFGPHQRFMVTQQLVHLDTLDDLIERVSVEITERLRPCATALAQLHAIPGVGRRTAEVLMAEVGLDLSRFPSAGHLAAWAGLAPGNNESAGRRRSGRRRKGNAHVCSILVEAAFAASRTRSRIGARYHRLHRRFGGRANPGAARKAAFAVAHTLIKIIWSVLAGGEPYTDLGDDYYTRRVDPQTRTRSLIAQLEALSGKKVVFCEHGDDPGGGQPRAA
jgi:transposase